MNPIDTFGDYRGISRWFLFHDFVYLMDMIEIKIDTRNTIILESCKPKTS